MVVFPLVPVIPTATKLLKGLLYTQDEIVPTKFLGDGSTKDGIEQSIFLSLKTATAPLEIAWSKKLIPCVFAPGNAINKSPLFTSEALIETPVITTSELNRFGSKLDNAFAPTFTGLRLMLRPRSLRCFALEILTLLQ